MSGVVPSAVKAMYSVEYGHRLSHVGEQCTPDLKSFACHTLHDTSQVLAHLSCNFLSHEVSSITSLWCQAESNLR